MSLDDIQKACRLGDVELLSKVLDENAAGLDQLDSKLGWAPLYRTVICGHYDATEFLLKRGANPNIQNRLGETPLHQAADNSLIPIVKLLFKHKADPNIQQNDGDTPLHLAAFKGHLKMVKLLLKNQSNTNIPNFVFGKTALHYAAEKGNVEVVQILINKDASPLIKDRAGKTPIDMAISEEVRRVLSEPVFDLSPCSPSRREEVKNDFSFEKDEHESQPVKVLEYQTDSFIYNTESFLEPEGEKTISKKPFNGPSSYRTFSFGIDVSKSSLFQWLCSKKLEEVFEFLVKNGFDDLNILFEQMQSDMPLTVEILTTIGIHKPGHRYRLLALLEEDSLIKENKTSNTQNLINPL